MKVVWVALKKMFYTCSKKLTLTQFKKSSPQNCYYFEKKTYLNKSINDLICNTNKTVIAQMFKLSFNNLVLC